MNNKGFTYIETIITIVILLTSLMLLYSIYSKILISEKNRLYYDNIAYVYKTQHIKQIIAENLDVDKFESWITAQGEQYIYFLGINSNIYKMGTDKTKLEEFYKLYNKPMLAYVTQENVFKLKECINKNDTTNTTCAKTIDTVNNWGGDDFRDYIKTLDVPVEKDDYDGILISVISETKSGQEYEKLDYNYCIQTKPKMDCEGVNYMSWVYMNLTSSTPVLTDPNFTYTYVHRVSNPGGAPYDAEHMTNNSGSDYYNINLINQSIDVSQVCITETNNSDSCIWNPIKEDKPDGGYCFGSSDYCGSYSIKLSNGDGLKTVYAYLKDTSENIYGPTSDTVTVDTVNPEVSLNITDSGISITASDNNEIHAIFFIKSQDGSVSYNSYSNPISLSEGTYQAMAFDKAGNNITTSPPKKIVSKSNIPAHTEYTRTIQKCVNDGGTYKWKLEYKTSLDACTAADQQVPTWECNQLTEGTSVIRACTGKQVTEKYGCPIDSTQIGSSNFCLKN